MTRITENVVWFHALAVAVLATTVMAGPDPHKPAEAPRGGPSAILNEADCTKAWEGAGGKPGGTITKDQAARFVSNVRHTDRDGDGKITEAEWRDACKIGYVASRPTTISPETKRY